jgi:organic hydroperoxide reductase OsmC/OhrA
MLIFTLTLSKAKGQNRKEMGTTHHYQATITWTGNTGAGTRDYRAYGRDHVITLEHKAPILASADPAFRGDPARHNPEELFLSALSGCHMLWYLHLCADQGIVVTDYQDNASATMLETGLSGGHFTEVTLRPRVTITDPSRARQAQALHAEANKRCYLANSCNFPVYHLPTCSIAGGLEKPVG